MSETRQKPTPLSRLTDKKNIARRDCFEKLSEKIWRSWRLMVYQHFSSSSEVMLDLSIDEFLIRLKYAQLSAYLEADK